MLSVNANCSSAPPRKSSTARSMPLLDRLTRGTPEQVALVVDQVLRHAVPADVLRPLARVALAAELDAASAGRSSMSNAICPSLDLL